MTNWNKSVIHNRAVTVVILIGALALTGQTAALAGNRVTKLSECGGTLTRPGIYVITADLTVKTNLSCFTITGSGVILLLNGHTITGIGNTGNALIHAYPPSPVDSALTDIKVLGPGTLANGYAGLEFDGIQNSVVQGVTASGNLFGFVANSGICNTTCLSSGNVFLSNTATNNAYHGFDFNGSGASTFSGNVSSNNGNSGFLLYNIVDGDFSGNTANSNGQDGFLIQTLSYGNVLSGNTAAGNQSYDAEDQNATCGTDVWSGDTFGTVNQVCVQ